MPPHSRSKRRTKRRAASPADQTDSQTAKRVCLAVPSTASLCDADSLSVLFSFLGTSDFLSATRCSRQWHSGGLRRRAWPSLSIDSLVQTLRDDDYNNAERRRLRLHIQHGNDIERVLQLISAAVQPAQAAGASVADSPAASSWRQAKDVRLSCQAPSRSESASDAAFKSTRCLAALQQVLALPQLSALTLDSVVIPNSATGVISELFGAASKLQALILSGIRVSRVCTYLSRLPQLRVLVLNQLPPASALITLTQLHYIHLEESRERHVNASDIGLVLRWLSVHHSLRCVSVAGEAVKALDPLLRPVHAAGTRPVAVAFELQQLQPSLEAALATPPHLIDLSDGSPYFHFLDRLEHIPTLRRLQVNLLCGDNTSVLAGLHELRLTCRHGGWHRLQHCSKLHTLRLQMHLWPPAPVSLQNVTAALVASAATLETVNLCNWTIDDQQGSWKALVQWPQLRTLSLTMQPLDWDALLGALGELPWFHTLGLFVEGPNKTLPPGLLRHMTARGDSPWRTLQLHLLRANSTLTARGVHMLETRMPPAEAVSDKAAQQVRVIACKESQSPHTHIITVDDRGRREWRMM